MAQYGVKIVGKIRVKKKSTNNGFAYFTTLLATNKDYKTEEEVVIYSSFYDGQVYTIPIKDFYTPHPKTGIPRYRLVTQSNNIIVKE